MTKNELKVSFFLFSFFFAPTPTPLANNAKPEEVLHCNIGRGRALVSNLLNNLLLVLTLLSYSALAVA